MNTIHQITFKGRKLLALTTLGVVALTPLYGAVTVAQAAPPDRAPAWGWRDKKGNTGKKGQKDKKDKSGRRGPWDDDRNRDDDRNDGAAHQNSTTVRGTVLRDLAGNDRFRLRTDNGRTFEVVSHDAEPRRLSQGDRVEVIGHIDRELLIAHEIRILSNNGSGSGGGNTGRRTVTGIVERDVSGNSFDLRGSDGRIFRVLDRSGEPIRLTVGDRVEAGGAFTQGVFIADRVRILRNDDPGKVDFSATVVSVLSRNRLNVRGDNGRTYTVDTRVSLSSTINAGDRVRIVGETTSRNAVQADRVDLLRDNNNNGGGNGELVNFTGTVTSVSQSSRILTVRGDHGTVWQVHVADVRAFRVNDRVTVFGRVVNGRVEATRVIRL